MLLFTCLNRFTAYFLQPFLGTSILFAILMSQFSFQGQLLNILSFAYMMEQAAKVQIFVKLLIGISPAMNSREEALVSG